MCALGGVGDEKGEERDGGEKPLKPTCSAFIALLLAQLGPIPIVQDVTQRTGCPR
jgi:hypothetical protein